MELEVPQVRVALIDLEIGEEGTIEYLLASGRSAIPDAHRLCSGRAVKIFPSRTLGVLTHLPLHNGRTPQLEQSAIARLGHGIAPLIRPLGFNWKIGVGLLTSVIAREVIVGTLGTIYGVDPATQSMTLQNALQQDLTPAGAMALLAFFAFAMQCTSTMAVVRRETNSWKWPLAQFAYMTGIAYSSAFLVNQVLSRFLK